MARRANSELVAVAWLASLAEIANNGQVATTLPEDRKSWVDSRFLVVGPAVGGDPEVYVPHRRPIFQLESFAVRYGQPTASEETSMKPDWAAANDLLEIVVDAAYFNENLGEPLTLRTGYRQARVTGVVPMTEPRKMSETASGEANYQMDIMIQWIEIPE